MEQTLIVTAFVAVAVVLMLGGMFLWICFKREVRTTILYLLIRWGNAIQKVF
ncbi:hypothetical protein [Staphylococcus pseudintermedius]|uniref:hypothetical protein n=1 Tax=Staphylococcus pseudintermedius TaxID=283734 RepID=UPI001F505C7E|nr:hypothetical protein [Staphylococcus pseudintermedius]